MMSVPIVIYDIDLMFGARTVFVCVRGYHFMIEKFGEGPSVYLRPCGSRGNHCGIRTKTVSEERLNELMALVAAGPRFPG